jgi:16S rRNA (cytosine967-C5)-methyltransferase
VYATLTRLRPIDAALDARLRKGLRSLKPDVRAHMRVACAQLGPWDDRTPDHAAVSRAVGMVKKRRGARVGGLVNAVLQSITRDADAWAPPKGGTTLDVFGHTHSLPNGLAELVVDLCGDDAKAAMDGFNAPTPVRLRVRGLERDDAIAMLADDFVTALPHPILPDALTVTEGNVVHTTAFREGFVTIQDAGAQLAVHLLPDEIDGAILDACAGLGGKTAHLLDTFDDDPVVATDTAADKLDVLRHAVGDTPRLTTVPWTIGNGPTPDFGGLAPFGAVLLDAPCSALGTMGRHPEVRWRRTAKDVRKMGRQQAHLLDTVASVVAPGGYLVYIVCTFTPAETHAVVDAFLERRADFEMAPPTEHDADARVPWSDLVDGRGRVALWPHLHEADAFFYARLRRVSDA